MTKCLGSLLVFLSLVFLFPADLSAQSSSSLEGLVPRPFRPEKGFQLAVVPKGKDILLSWHRPLAGGFLSEKIWDSYRIEYLYTTANNIKDGQLTSSQCRNLAGWTTATHRNGRSVEGTDEQLPGRVEWKIEGGNDPSNPNRIAQPALFRLVGTRLEDSESALPPGGLPAVLTCSTKAVIPAVTTVGTVQIRFEAYNGKISEGKKVAAKVTVDGKDLVSAYGASKSTTDITIQIPKDDPAIFNRDNPHKIKFTADGYKPVEMDQVFYFQNTHRAEMESLTSQEDGKVVSDPSGGGTEGEGGDKNSSNSGSEEECNKYLGFGIAGIGRTFDPLGWMGCQARNLISISTQSITNLLKYVPI